MASRYRDEIETYCAQAGIAIPSGFYRRTPNRYVAVDLDPDRTRLIATTWFKLEDVAYYLNRLAAGKSMRILDFKERRELHPVGESKFARGDSF